MPLISLTMRIYVRNGFHFSCANIIESVREKVILFSIAHNSRTDHIVSVNLRIPKLASGGSLTLFPNCSKYLSRYIKCGLSRDEKSELIGQDNFEKAIYQKGQ